MPCIGDRRLIFGNVTSLEVLGERIEVSKLQKAYITFLESYPSILESRPYIPEFARERAEELLLTMDGYERYLKKAIDMIQAALQNVIPTNGSYQM